MILQSRFVCFRVINHDHVNVNVAVKVLMVVAVAVAAAAALLVALGPNSTQWLCVRLPSLLRQVACSHLFLHCVLLTVVLCLVHTRDWPVTGSGCELCCHELT